MLLIYSFVYNLAAGSIPSTCCDTKQLETLDNQVGLAANFLSRCPSCLQNLVAHICDMTCSPEQSRFINVTQTEKDENGRETYFFKQLLHFIDFYSGYNFKSNLQFFLYSCFILLLFFFRN
jgi:Niemann-Pick C1 protein